MNKIIITFFLGFSFLLSFNHGSRKNIKHDTKLIQEYKYELTRLSPLQQYWMNLLYTRCSKYGLSYTCVAIAWEETKFNKWAFNPLTKDYGLMGINLYWYMLDNNLPWKNRYKRIEAATRLIKDDEYNIQYAISKLLKLKQEENGDWIRIWGRYNGGSKPNYHYANHILNRIIAFKQWKKSIHR